MNQKSVSLPVSYLSTSSISTIHDYSFHTVFLLFGTYFNYYYQWFPVVYVGGKSIRVANEWSWVQT